MPITTLRLAQSLALGRCGAIGAVRQPTVPRQLNFPLEAFDELQAIKRRHGLGRNVDAVSYALFAAAIVDESAQLPALPATRCEEPHE